MKMEEVTRIMDRHAPDLMKIEGVVGVAIGAQKDSSLCIQVLVRDSPEEMAGDIPDTLEGVPIVIVQTGEIRPMGD